MLKSKITLNDQIPIENIRFQAYLVSLVKAGLHILINRDATCHAGPKSNLDHSECRSIQPTDQPHEQRQNTSGKSTSKQIRYVVPFKPLVVYCYVNLMPNL